jgi:hypothetical protein
MCVWFEKKGGWNIAINGFLDMDIMLSVWLDGYGEPIFCLVRWISV